MILGHTGRITEKQKKKKKDTNNMQKIFKKSTQK